MKTRKLFNPLGELGAILFWCPGCNDEHTFSLKEVDTNGVKSYPQGPHAWSWDGNLECPTFQPSLLYPDKKPRCHIFLHKGIIEFLGDCGHELKGKKVPLPDIPASSPWAKVDE